MQSPRCLPPAARDKSGLKREMEWNYISVIEKEEEEGGGGGGGGGKMKQ